MLQRSLLLLLALVLGVPLLAQEPVTIRGRVVSTDHQEAFYDLMVVNKRTRSGTFGNSDGTFEVKALRTDTILLGAVGHTTVPICMADSAVKDSYYVRIRLQPITVQLPAVEVLPERTLKEIQKDIAQLGYDEKDYRISNVDALQSPITFLYQQFSRRERSKRMVAELQNEQRKRELLKELLHKYVEYDIINLSDDAFDDFIDFCAVPDPVIKGLSQYEFLLYVKKKYELYSSLGPTRRH
ncbi:MAG: hypothetical protein H6595_02815 [Flavobacteriales bacterium]|nr:hypothetical protein [Flavobacteriales bacterium]MCB9166390.1 hypothetical protein [Flavobacteriales bacterium]